jgi:DNA-binding transcriptional ArsR family regulator
MHSYIKNTGSIIEAADMGRILSDPTRLEILKTLFQNREGMCVYEIAESVGSSPSATSHQLARLEAYDVVECYREGQKMCYVLTKTPQVARIEKLLTILDVV